MDNLAVSYINCHMSRIADNISRLRLRIAYFLSNASLRSRISRKTVAKRLVDRLRKAGTIRPFCETRTSRHIGIAHKSTGVICHFFSFGASARRCDRVLSSRHLGSILIGRGAIAVLIIIVLGGIGIIIVIVFLCLFLFAPAFFFLFTPALLFLFALALLLGLSALFLLDLLDLCIPLFNLCLINLCLLLCLADLHRIVRADRLKL